MKTIYVLRQEIYFDEAPFTQTLSAGFRNDVEDMLGSINPLEITGALEDKTPMYYFIDVVTQDSDEVKSITIKVAETNFEVGTLEWYYKDINKILDGKYE